MQDILAHNHANFKITMYQYFLGRNDILPLGDYLEELYKNKKDARKIIV
jgi:hypothetical protein